MRLEACAKGSKFGAFRDSFPKERTLRGDSAPLQICKNRVEYCIHSVAESADFREALFVFSRRAVAAPTTGRRFAPT